MLYGENQLLTLYLKAEHRWENNDIMKDSLYQETPWSFSSLVCFKNVTGMNMEMQGAREIREKPW